MRIRSRKPDWKVSVVLGLFISIIGYLFSKVNVEEAVFGYVCLNSLGIMFLVLAPTSKAYAEFLTLAEKKTSQEIVDQALRKSFPIRVQINSAILLLSGLGLLSLGMFLSYPNDIRNILLFSSWGVCMIYAGIVYGMVVSVCRILSVMSENSK